MCIVTSIINVLKKIWHIIVSITSVATLILAAGTIILAICAIKSPALYIDKIIKGDEKSIYCTVKNGGDEEAQNILVALKPQIELFNSQDENIGTFGGEKEKGVYFEKDVLSPKQTFEINSKFLLSDIPPAEIFKKATTQKLFFKYTITYIYWPLRFEVLFKKHKKRTGLIVYTPEGWQIR